MCATSEAGYISSELLMCGRGCVRSILLLSLNNNKIPHIWKLANIVPIPIPNKDIDKDTPIGPYHSSQ